MFTKLRFNKVDLLRYINLSKKTNEVDIQRYLIRIVLIVTNLLFSLAVLLSVSSSGNFYKITVIHYSLYFLLDILLTSSLLVSTLKQRIDYLSYVRGAFLSLSFIAVIFLTMLIYTRSPYLSNILMKQNYIYFGIPMWNITIMLPLFVIFFSYIFINIDDLKKLKEASEIEVLQNEFLIAVKIMTLSLISVNLFFGGDSLLGLLDFFNFSFIEILLIKKLIFVTKAFSYMAILNFMMKIMVSKKIVTRVLYFKRILKVSLLYFLGLCLFRVLI